MFKIILETAPIEYLENELDKFGKQTMPYAIRDTLNTTAYEASKEAKIQARRVFTMRNQWTERSIRFDKARGRNINQMESAVGSLQEYMREQEEGFTQHAKGKHGVPIPTSYAAGQEGARPRSKPIRRSNWLQRLKMARSKRRAANKGQEIVQAVYEAITTGQRTVFLPLRRPGIYKVLRGRKTGRGFPKGAKLKMLYSLEDRTIRTEAHKWLEPAVMVVMEKQDDYYRKSVIRQIKYHRQFRSR